MAVHYTVPWLPDHPEPVAGCVWQALILICEAMMQLWPCSPRTATGRMIDERAIALMLDWPIDCVNYVMGYGVRLGLWPAPIGGLNGPQTQGQG